MSSKLVQPAEQGQVRPFAFRKIDAERETVRQLAGDLEREFAARAAQLERECEHKVADARAAGFDEGLAAGRHQAAAEVQPVLERMARTIDEIGQMRARLRKEAEGDLVKLALAIARRVIRRELAIDPDALRGLVLAALEKLKGQEISRIRVHPGHAGPLAAALPPASGGSPLEIVPDPSCQPGGVVFETSRGNLDAGVETQLSEIERGLADRLRRSS